MTEKECHDFVAIMSNSLQTTFGDVVTKVLPHEHQIPLNVILSSLTLFVAATINKIYILTDIFPDQQKVVAKEFCEKLENLILTMNAQKDVH